MGRYPLGHGGSPVLSAELQQAPQLRAVAGLLQAMALIPLAHDALEARVTRAVAENPMLRRAQQISCPVCGSRRIAGRCPRCPQAAPIGREPVVNPFETLEALAGCQVASAHRNAVPVVIDHLTARGLLDSEPAQIAADHALPLAAVEAAVQAIREVGPAGIAQRTVSELLAAQAQQLVSAGQAQPWLVDLVRDHLPAIADDDPQSPAEQLGVPAAAVAEAFDLVRSRLRPMALPDREPEGPPPSPDVFVYRDAAGELTVEVIDSRWLGLRVAAVPAAVRSDPAAVAWLEEHRRQAATLLRQIDSRATVLHQVATCAVSRQAGFFTRGRSGHRRLTRTEVAHELGLHPSTVSRAVTAKIVRCPDGRLIEFAALFGGGVAIQDLIRQLTERQRLSDSQLCSALAAQGYVVARRTVAKYRAQLGIAAAGRVRT